MTATSTRIGFVTQATRNVTSGPDATVQAKYGALARDTKDEPFESFFDDTADAQAMLDERFALLKADRRRFQVSVGRLTDALSLSYTQANPTATLVDDERAVNAAVGVVSMSLNFETNEAQLTVWG